MNYLLEDEWALQAALAGSICQQVGPNLLQAGQHRATGTAHREKQQQGAAEAADDLQQKCSFCEAFWYMIQYFQTWAPENRCL